MDNEHGDFYHLPVMEKEVLSFYPFAENSIYVDATLGGAGHASALLREMGASSQLVAIDRDREAMLFAIKRIGGDDRVVFFQNRFSEIDKIRQETGHEGCAGILADLGVSSHQINAPERGFSFMRDGPLDLRMDQSANQPVSVLLDSVNERELADILFKFGEERRSRPLARAIIAAHGKEPVVTTRQLVEILTGRLPFKNRIKSIARVFQALRIWANGELDELALFLEDAFNWLAPGGRLIVISYHSLEDRMVKHFMQKKAQGCICPIEIPVCTCGRTPLGKVLTRKVVRPQETEIKENTRARSAKLRAIEKV